MSISLNSLRQITISVTIILAFTPGYPMWLIFALPCTLKQSLLIKTVHENFIKDLQQRRLNEAQDEYDQEQEILKEEFDTERWIYKC